MQEWIIDIMDVYGYLGICTLIAVENIFPPIPSEVILTFGGFMTTYTRLSVPGVVIFATLGAGIGALILYWIGTCLTPEKMKRYSEMKWLRSIGFASDKVEKAAAWFDHYGKKAIFFGRCVPIVRSLISIPAGMAQVPMPYFLFWTFLGSSIWNTVLVLLGATVGASWEIIIVYVDRYSMVIGIVVAAVFIAWTLRRRWKRKS